MLLKRCLIVLACSSACSATHVTLKAPVEERCQRQRMRGCERLADGVVLLANGEARAGARELRKAAALNPAPRVTGFARSLRELTTAATTAEFAEAISQAAAVLEANGTARMPAFAPGALPRAPSPARLPAPGPRPPEHTARGSEPGHGVSFDPTRMREGTRNVARDPKRVRCVGGTSWCTSLELGPFIVTDVLAEVGCPDQLFVGAFSSEEGEPRWLVPAGFPGVHGGRFLLRPSETLRAVLRPLKGEPASDARCSVTWAGFALDPPRPPTPGRTGDADAAPVSPQANPYR